MYFCLDGYKDILNYPIAILGYGGSW